MKIALLALVFLATGLRLGHQSEPEQSKPQEAFALDELLASAKENGAPWLGFIERPSMTCGVYHLDKGAKDGQAPHRYDEVYYVVAGKAVLQAGEEKFPAQAGSILFVEREVEHRFLDIEEDLTVVVFFSKLVEEQEKGK